MVPGVYLTLYLPLSGLCQVAPHLNWGLISQLISFLLDEFVICMCLHTGIFFVCALSCLFFSSSFKNLFVLIGG